MGFSKDAINLAYILKITDGGDELRIRYPFEVGNFEVKCKANFGEEKINKLIYQESRM